MNKSIQLEEGLAVLDETFQKARRIVEGFPDTKFTPDEYMKCYNCVYILCDKICTRNNPLLYEIFKKSLQDIIISSVLPSLAAKENELLLRELVLMWSNYKLMTMRLCRLFEYMDRCYVRLNSHESLSDISIDVFCNLVLNELFNRVLEASMSLINQERHGQLIDATLLQDVMGMLMETGEKRSTFYYKIIEEAMLKETATFYSYLSSQWILYDLLADYTQKVNRCIWQEKEIAKRYLRPTFMKKLIQAVRFQLLDVHASRLVEKQQSENSSQLDFQEILAKCACLNLGDDSSSSMASSSSSSHIH